MVNQAACARRVKDEYRALPSGQIGGDATISCAVSRSIRSFLDPIAVAEPVPRRRSQPVAMDDGEVTTVIALGAQPFIARSSIGFIRPLSAPRLVEEGVADEALGPGEAP